MPIFFNRNLQPYNDKIVRFMQKVERFSFKKINNKTKDSTFTLIAITVSKI